MIFLTIHDLASEVIIRAIFTIVYVIINILTGIKLILKFRKYEWNIFLSAGIFIILLGSPYWGFTFSFLSVLILNYQIELPIVLLLSWGSPFIGATFWSYLFGKLYKKEVFKKIFYSFFIFCIGVLIIFIILLFINHEIFAIDLKIQNDPFQYRVKLITYLFPFIAIMIIIVTGTLFCFKSFKSNNLEIIWKGRFLLAGFYLIIIATVIEMFSFGNIIMQVSARLVMTISSLSIYLGFFLPLKLSVKLIKNLEEDDVLVIPNQLDNIQDFYKLLQLKPKSITIKEVNYFREQRLCLVCKGNIGETKFLCYCGALYCTKCTFALIEIENICWACENALDKTKPVKMTEWVEDNVAHILPEKDEHMQKKKN